MIVAFALFVSALTLGCFGWVGLRALSEADPEGPLMRNLKETVEPWLEVAGEIGLEGVWACLEASARLAGDLLLSGVELLGTVLGFLLEGLGGLG